MGLIDRIKSWFPSKKNSRSDSNQRRSSRLYWQKNSIYLDNIYNKIATDVAMAKFKHVKITRIKDKPDQMEWLQFSNLSNVLTYSPNELDTPIVFWSNVVRKMLQDQYVVVVPFYENGELAELEIADSAVINNATVTLYINSERYVLPIGNVWIFENPKQNLSVQLNQVTTLIDDALRALSYKVNEKPSTLRGFLKLPTKAEDGELKKKAQDRVKNIMETAADGEIGYLQKDEEFQELNNTYGTASKEEMEFLKQQLYNSFGINEDLFTCDYNEDQYRAYYQSVLKLYIRVIAEEINRKYFTKTARTQGQKLLFYVDLFDIASLKDLNEFAFKQKYSGNMNSNEIREIFGYGAYEGGEIFETNKNAVQIGIGGGEEVE
ncbi:phage portal protein [Enterococcus dispar]|uniref:phage portal protein n=2 Tax=Bacteria TaxID=2 RepID=UPI00039A758D|nr:phage portal protein [Enterococcus dispar]OJG38457.1 phage portal protein [Enterococcus dispar]